MPTPRAVKKTNVDNMRFPYEFMEDAKEDVRFTHEFMEDVKEKKENNYL